MIPGGSPDEPRSRLEPSVEEDVRRELESHLALQVAELVEAGWSETDARVEAFRRFGNFASVLRRSEAEARAHARANRLRTSLMGLREDLDAALARLLGSPRFTVVALLILALAIGANAAVFSVLQGVLFEPLPYPAADRLVWIEEAHRGPDGAPDPVPWLNFLDWQTGTKSFEAMAAFRSEVIPVAGGGEATRVRGAVISERFWDVFQPEVLLGRVTGPEEHRPRAGISVVVSERFWSTHLEADSSVVGRTIRLSGISARVIGVLGETLHFPEESDFWTPAESISPALSRTAHNWRVAGLLRPGIDVSRADQELDRLSAEMVQTLPGEDHDLTGAVVTPLKSAVVGEAPDTLYLLMAASGLLLLIACTNLASTVLAREVRRARELAVRAALGASRGRLLRQLAMEGAMLSLGGAGLGLGLAALLVVGIRGAAIEAIPRLGEVGIRWEVVAFTLGVAISTTILCGVVPALRATGKPLRSATSSGLRETGAPTRVWSLLVGGQVALASALLVLGGALLQSFQGIIRDDPGFTRQGIMTVEVTLPDNRNLTTPSPVHRRVLENLRRRPQVDQVAVANWIPLSQGLLPVGRVHQDRDSETPSPPGVYLAVSPEYFDLLEIELIAGRTFTDEDDAGAPHVAVVSKGFAERLWPEQDPLGKVITSVGMDSFWKEGRWARVVGVVEDLKYRDLWGPRLAAYYFPVHQRPSRTRQSFFVLVRSRGADPGDVASVLEATLGRLAPEASLSILSMEERARASLRTRRLALQLVGGFAATALLLAGLGLYGVLSYLVASRRQEMGIRLALGARPSMVRMRVLREGLRMMAGGLVAGCGILAVSVPLVRPLLYESTVPSSPVILGVAGLLLSVGMVASWIPGGRATAVDVPRALTAD